MTERDGSAAIDQKIAFAALAYRQMNVPELLDAIRYQRGLLADPRTTPETHEIASRCLEVCLNLLPANEA